MKTNHIKIEGKALNVDKETLDNQKVFEVGNEIADNTKLEKEDKPNFEEYKTLYKGAIDEKCLATYGTTDDEKLWEDIAKEMFLKTLNYIPDDDTKVSGDLVKKESKRIIQHTRVTLTETKLVENEPDEDDDVVVENRRFIKHNIKTESVDCSRQKLVDRNPLSDSEKLKYYYGTYKVGQSIPYEIYKINDKFYDGNGVEIDSNELKECSRQK